MGDVSAWLCTYIKDSEPWLFGQSDPIGNKRASLDQLAPRICLSVKLDERYRPFGKSEFCSEGRNHSAKVKNWKLNENLTLLRLRLEQVILGLPSPYTKDTRQTNRKKHESNRESMKGEERRGKLNPGPSNYYEKPPLLYA